MSISIRSISLFTACLLTLIVGHPSYAQSNALQYDGGRFLQGTGDRRINDSLSLGDGNIAVCGSTTSDGFATPGAAFETLSINPSNGSRLDAFVAIYNEQTLALQAATYIGGTGFDECESLAVSPDGTIVLVGETQSDDFPVSNAFDSTLNGGMDGFVASFSADLGTLNFATYVGGTGSFASELLLSVAVAQDGTIHTTGITHSADLQVTELFDNRACVSFDFGSTNTDLLYARFDSDGALLNMYCLGGDTGRSAGYEVVAGPQGKVYVAGRTDSGEFTYPASVINLADPTPTNRYLFLLELSNATAAIERAILLVARLDGFPFITDMQFTDDGELIVVGGSNAPGIIPSPNAIKSELVETELSEPEFPDYYAAGILLRLNQAVTTVNYATYIGGDISHQYIRSLAVDSSDEIWITFETVDQSLPVLNAPDSSINILSSEIPLGIETSGARDFSIALQPINQTLSNGLLAQNGQNYSVAYPENLTRFLLPEPIGSSMSDTRDIALSTFGSTGRGVLVNYNDVNFAFTNGFSIGSIPFGAGSELSTHAAVSNDRIYVVNDGQPNRIYTWPSGSNITETGTFGNVNDGIVGVEYTDFLGLLTAQSPNKLVTYSTSDGSLLDELTLDGMLINEMRVNDTYNIILISNANGASEILVTPFGGQLDSLTRVVVDPDVPGILSMTMGFEQGQLRLLAATSDAVHIYNVDVSNGWQIVKIGESASSVTAPQFGENRFGSFNDVVPVADANGPAVYRHINSTDFYMATIDAVAGAQLTGAYLGGAGRDSCACAVSITNSGDAIFAANTFANDMTGVSETDNSIGEKSALVRLTQIDNMLDTDADGVPDFEDNCTNEVNTAQTDSDGDGYGNACDSDFDNNCTINFVDLSLFADAFLGSNELFDLNDDANVNFLDFSILTDSFFQNPGPGLGNCPLP